MEYVFMCETFETVHKYITLIPNDYWAGSTNFVAWNINNKAFYDKISIVACADKHTQTRAWYIDYVF